MLSFQDKKERETERKREKKIYFRLVSATVCVSVAEINNPLTPSCASRHLEKRENYFIAGEGKSLPKIQIYQKWIKEENTDGNENTLIVLKEA